MTVGYWGELPVRRPRPGRTAPGDHSSDSLYLTNHAACPSYYATRRSALPGTILVEPDRENGLRSPSVALVFQLTAVDSVFVKDRLGNASDLVLQEIFAALDALTGRT